jgi:acyl carrier protein
VGKADAAAVEVDATIVRLVQEFALNAPAGQPLGPELSLRDEIGLDSFALVSLMLRLGEEFNVDFAEESARLGVDLGQISTFGDLLRLGRALSETAR